jgi:1-acyl-sn-glycerol-3-phosphate acyltransferase
MVWRFQGVKINISGAEHVPAAGGAVIAINHTSYLDFTFAGLPAYSLRPHRWVRFMAKKETFDNRFTGPMMRGCRHIPVDRGQGADSFTSAVDYLKAGELVGVYPEATISRSFELKEFKSGTARMAIEAQVPIIPHIVWGAQRIWTKDHPKQLGRTKVPITVAVGEPIPPTLPVDDLRALLHTRMQHLLEQVQDGYPEHPAGAYWVPHRLGGGAPTPAEAAQLDAEEAARKTAERAARNRQLPGATGAAE